MSLLRCLSKLLWAKLRTAGSHFCTAALSKQVHTRWQHNCCGSGRQAEPERLASTEPSEAHQGKDGRQHECRGSCKHAQPNRCGAEREGANDDGRQQANKCDAAKCHRAHEDQAPDQWPCASKRVQSWSEMNLQPQTSDPCIGHAHGKERRCLSTPSKPSQEFQDACRAGAEVGMRHTLGTASLLTRR